MVAIAAGNLTGKRPAKHKNISLDLGRLPTVMKLKPIYAELCSETVLK